MEGNILTEFTPAVSVWDRQLDHFVKARAWALDRKCKRSSRAKPLGQKIYGGPLCKRGHEFGPVPLVGKNGHRRCRECKKIADKQRRAEVC